MNIAQVLQYLGESRSREKRAFDFTGDVDQDTQEQFDAVVWNDTREKPLWDELVLAEPYATLWHARRSWRNGI